MPSRLPHCTSHRIALQLAISFIHHRHNHHRHHGTVVIPHPSIRSSSLVLVQYGGFSFFFTSSCSWSCCESSCSSHALNLGVFTKRILLLPVLEARFQGKFSGIKANDPNPRIRILDWCR